VRRAELVVCLIMSDDHVGLRLQSLLWLDVALGVDVMAG
jgi:hypothetical protein